MKYRFEGQHTNNCDREYADPNSNFDCTCFDLISKCSVCSELIEGLKKIEKSPSITFGPEDAALKLLTARSIAKVLLSKYGGSK